MIDWHTHILPGMDDGSRNTAESLSMMTAQASQGVGTVIATPHFYANDETVGAFLERRAEALELLRSELPDGAPEIIPGAEVKYYQGISRLAELESLRIEGSNLLLLEMPMTAWTEYMVRELTELSGKGGRLILAHIERYLGLQKQSIWERIYDSGILTQVNASFFTSFFTRRKSISLLEEGRIHFVGSDCHNMISRPPRVGRAYDIIQKKLGEDYIGQMNEYGHSLLAK